MKALEPELIFDVPLRVRVSKKKFFILNLNNYRNAHHRVLSTAKNNFTDIIVSMGLRDKFQKIRVVYKIYPATNRNYDGMNVISVIDKFTMDALVKVGVIPDDNIKHVVCPLWEPMPPDKENPRVEVLIYGV